MNSAKKILILQSTLEFVGGAELVVLSLAKNLTQKAYQVRVASCQIAPFFIKEFKQYNIEYINLPQPGGRINEWYWYYIALRLAPSLRWADLVNTHNFPSNIWLLYAQRLCISHPPILWTCHEAPRNVFKRVLNEHYANSSLTNANFYTDHPDTMNWIQRTELKATKLSGAILCNSLYSFHKTREIYGQTTDYHWYATDPNIITEQNSGIDADNFFKPAAPYFIVISRLENEKNVPNVIRAFSIFKRYTPNPAQLVILGKGREEIPCKNLIRELHLQNDVQMIPFAPNTAKQQLLKNAITLIYLSLDEPLGLVPLEAALLGVPTIATNHGGPAETVQHQITGLCVDPLDIHAIAKTLNDCLTQPEAMRHMGKAAQRWVNDQYSFTRFFDWYLEHCHQLMKARS